MKFSAYTKVQKRLLVAIVFMMLLIGVTLYFGIFWIQSILHTPGIPAMVVDTVDTAQVNPVLTTDEKLQILQELSRSSTTEASDARLQKDILSTLKTGTIETPKVAAPPESSPGLQVN